MRSIYTARFFLIVNVLLTILGLYSSRSLMSPNPDLEAGALWYVLIIIFAVVVGWATGVIGVLMSIPILKTNDPAEYLTGVFLLVFSATAILTPLLPLFVR